MARTLVRQQAVGYGWTFVLAPASRRLGDLRVFITRMDAGSLDAGVV